LHEEHKEKEKKSDTFASMNADEQYMDRCIEIALNGLGRVAPNPLVGAVIISNERIIGEGFHQQFGGPHAEVHAISNAQKFIEEKKGPYSLEKSVLYVNLEPCSHFGKTPPCVDLIIEHKIPKVVIANIDPFAKVNGEGVKKLEKAGVKVMTGVREEEGKELNKRFFTFHLKERPYIIIKYAQSKDGFIAGKERNSGSPYISNQYSLTLSHRWRSEEQAIMVGTNTVIVDNPSLTVRHWKGKNPMRVVTDRTLKLDKHLSVFNSDAPTLVFNEIKNESAGSVEYIKIDFSNDAPQRMMNELYKRDIQSVIIEGGTKLLQSFIDINLWDEARIFTGNKWLGEGVKAPLLKGEIISKDNIEDDELIILRPHP
jgi:diaminohydroxyphosphoribosylaminopyrimidine deaminase / 5-amino-6-(5-phosphoribosylamino)uracil reductase